MGDGVAKPYDGLTSHVFAHVSAKQLQRLVDLIFPDAREELARRDGIAVCICYHRLHPSFS